MTLPKNFKEIPINENQKPHIEFPPTLSIVLHISDNVIKHKTIDFTVSSILSQNFNDYEFIIVDSSKKENEKIRSLAKNKNVLIIRENPSTEKYSAWNKAIQSAQGEYLLFTTEKDFIVSQTLNIFEQMLYEYLKIFKKGYVTHEDYYKVYPNVVSATKIIVEDTNGSLTIGGVGNKKFSIQVDARFQELKWITEITISERDKLIMLATKQINNHLGTKFFKRSFLNENNIRFDENLSAESTELKFLTDTFLHTEKISFMPQVFYGRLN